MSEEHLVVVRADADAQSADGLFAGVAEVEHLVVVEDALLLVETNRGEDAARVRPACVSLGPGVRREAEAYDLSLGSFGLSARSFLLSFFLSTGFLSFSALDMRLLFN